MNGHNEAVIKAAIEAQARTFKTLDFSVDSMRLLRQQIPDLFLVGRLYTPHQDLGQTSDEAKVLGQMFARKLLRECQIDQQHVNGTSTFSAFESYNEVLGGDEPTDAHRRYDDFQVAFAEVIRQNSDAEPIFMNFATGNGSAKQWLECFPGSLESAKVLGFHEYDFGDFFRHHNQSLAASDNPDDWFPGGMMKGTGGHWLVGRYRRILNSGIIQKYGDKFTVYISEMGMTQGVNGVDGDDWGPWHEQFTGRGQRINVPIPTWDYFNSLIDASDFYQVDQAVIGAAMFVTGASGDEKWPSFEHHPKITEMLLDYQRVATEPPTSAPSTPLEQILEPLREALESEHADNLRRTAMWYMNNPKSTRSGPYIGRALTEAINHIDNSPQ